MLKRLLLVAIVISAVCTKAYSQAVDSLIVDARGSFVQHQGDGGWTGVLKAEYFNVQMWGSINDRLSYRIRQRLNVGIDTENPFRATDWLCLYWQVNPKVKLYGGRTAILIGGYEYDSAPIDVYYYSRFCDNLGQFFAFSVNGEYAIRPGQSLVLQIANSPLSNRPDDKFSYNLAWQGHFCPQWETLWSVNMVEDAHHRMLNYVALGNHCVFGPLAVDLDLFHRASFEQRAFLMTDYSVISKIIWSVGRWNICTKFGYERNDAGNVDAWGNAFDTVIEPGSESWYGGAGVEYFPLGNDKVRLHLAAFNNTYDHSTAVTLGLKWRLEIIKR